MAEQPDKTPTRAQLFERVLDTVDARLKATGKLERELHRLYEGYFQRVRAIVAADATLTKTDAMTLQTTVRVMTQLNQVLAEAGLSDVVASYHDQFEPITRAAVRYFEPFGLEPSLAGVSGQDLTAFVSVTSETLGKSITDQLVIPVQSALLQANFGNLDRQAVIDQVLGLEPSMTPTRATTFVDDAFAQYQRAVVTQKADDADMEIYVYLGPDDAITSDQCRAMLAFAPHGVPGMAYKDEVTIDLHPKLRANPLIAGGHPGCRHHWSPVTLAYAVERGFKPRS